MAAHTTGPAMVSLPQDLFALGAHEACLLHRLELLLSLVLLLLDPALLSLDELLLLLEEPCRALALLPPSIVASLASPRYLWLEGALLSLGLEPSLLSGPLVLCQLHIFLLLIVHKPVSCLILSLPHPLG